MRSGASTPVPCTVVVIAVEAGVSGPSSWGPGLTPRGPHAAERPGRKPVGERGVRIWDHALATRLRPSAGATGPGNRGSDDDRDPMRGIWAPCKKETGFRSHWPEPSLGTAAPAGSTKGSYDLAIPWEKRSVVPGAPRGLHLRARTEDWGPSPADGRHAAGSMGTSKKVVPNGLYNSLQDLDFPDRCRENSGHPSAKEVTYVPRAWRKLSGSAQQRGECP